ncbi:hypothetical protein XELAEV_18031462mg [Xenopus laevis]|uniref:Uncharacterized protein n=1 Tax=Xenopus laevis TaxID=8355 RepID=A0A974CN38_XENLA|nr:hypothetical protein XELAEV_18031462mg [Xenopus laevis]
MHDSEHKRQRGLETGSVSAHGDSRRDAPGGKRSMQSLTDSWRWTATTAGIPYLPCEVSRSILQPVRVEIVLIISS